MNKNNINLLVYSLMPKLGIIISVKIYIIFIHCILFYLARKIKKICVCLKINLFLFIYSLALE